MNGPGSSQPMPRAAVAIDDPADPRLADFVALRQPQARRAIERNRSFFVVEGVRAIEQLLRSDYRVRALFLTPNKAAALAPLLTDCSVPAYVVAPEVMEATAGFDVHRGALASADRPDAATAQNVVGAQTASCILVIEGLTDVENLGGLFRNAAAFGVGAVLLDPTCADPLYRRSIRVSLGHVLHLPFARLPDWPSELEWLTASGYETIALTPSGEESLYDIEPARAGSRRLALLAGAEGPGLSAAAMAAAARRVRIPIASGVDSLNVATAVAVALSHLSPMTT